MADIIGGMYSYLDPERASDFAMEPDQMLNLADTFVSSLEKDLQSLAQVMVSKEITELRRLLHTLKGYVTFLCTESLGQQLISLEAGSRDKDFAQLAPAVSTVLPLLNELLKEVQHWRAHVLQHQA
jgi:HPt (histidine-containing phosphotransfer) domain-containing protein